VKALQMPENPAPALDVRDLSYRFGKREALSGLSLVVPRGGFVALLGPNGAGKTTLFSIVTRFFGSRAGQVGIFGHDLHAEPSLALAAIGVVFQARTVDPDLTVLQNLVYHAALHGLAGASARRRIDALLDRAGLSDRIHSKIATLSGGQTRRIEIARALVHAPRLLLLDEATVGLDLESRRSIGVLVRELVRETGVSVLWATHLLDEIEPDDAVAVMHRGRIVATGSARAIASSSTAGSLEDAFRALTREEGAG
jgi:ABC-2 type transport system ATP-binding protein